MPRTLENLTTLDMILALQSAGYVVRHKSEARPVSWHRVAPFPTGVDFKTEALEKLREAITPELIEFSARADDLGVEIHSATLRVM